MSAGERHAGAADWTEIRQRLARASDALAETFEPSPEHAARILADRARVASRRGSAAETRGEIECTVFSAGSEHYAVETRHVLSVLPAVETTSIPGAPDSFIGLMNLRGEILPVIDLPRFLGLGRVGSAAPWTLILGGVHPEFAVAIDRTVEIRWLRAAEILALPHAANGEAECRRGITRDAVVVIDGAALLDDRRLFINDAAAQAAPG